MNTRTTASDQLPLPIYKVVIEDADYKEFARYLNEIAERGYRIAAVLPADADHFKQRAVIMERLDDSGCVELTDQDAASEQSVNAQIVDCFERETDLVDNLLLSYQGSTMLREKLKELAVNWSCDLAWKTFGGLLNPTAVYKAMLGLIEVYVAERFDTSPHSIVPNTTA